jgi:hypothetical protein
MSVSQYEPYGPRLLTGWSHAERVAWFMAASQPYVLCDDAHPMKVEPAHVECPDWVDPDGDDHWK